MEHEEIITQIEAELKNIAADPNYDGDEAENQIFQNIENLTGWTSDGDQQANDYILGANQEERLRYALKIVKNHQSQVGEAGSVQSLLAEVKNLTIEELKFCNQDTTPLVCQMISTEEGHEKIVKLVVEYVGKYGMSISEAIVSIENERNLNLNEMG